MPETQAQAQAWSTPAWMTSQGPAAAPQPQQPAAQPHRHADARRWAEPAPVVHPDDSSPEIDGVARASLEEVAVRMQRIKAGAAAVRRAVQEELARTQVPLREEDAAAARTVFDGPRLPDKPEAPAPVQVAAAPAAPVATTASGVFETPAPAVEVEAASARPEREVGDGFDELDREFERDLEDELERAQAHSRDDEDLDDGFGTPGFEGFDDFDDDDDEGYEEDMAGLGELAAAPRPMPWKGILAGAGVVVVLGTALMWDSLFGGEPEQDLSAQTDEAAETRGAEAQDAAPEQPAPSEGKPVQPETPAQAQPAQPPPPAAPDPATLEKVQAAKDLYMEASESGGGARRKKLEETGTILTEVLGKYPDLADALVIMAQVQLEQGQEPEALQTANHCVQVSPEQADCWLTIGVIKQNARETEAAVSAFERYLALAPDGKYAGDIQKLLKTLK